MQLLRALKLATSAKYTAKGLSLWLYTRVKNLLFYIIRHPFRSIFRFIKIYLVTLLTLMFLAFALSGIVSAQQAEHNPCPNGGTLLNGMCTTPIGQSTIYTLVTDRRFTNNARFSGSGKSMQEAFSQIEPQLVSHYSTIYSDGVSDFGPAYNNCVVTRTGTRIVADFYKLTSPYRYSLTVYQTRTNNGNCGTSIPNSQPLDDGTLSQLSAELLYLTTSQGYQCPPDGQPQFNQGPYQTEEGQNLCFYPAVPAEPEPECDCRNYAGQALTTANTLIAKKGVYSRENPPQCVTQTENAVGRDEPLTCTCQVSAQKWFSMASGSENERWETLPVQNGQPSGTFTGVKCGEKDGGPLEPEEDAPKECFTLQNGIKWCWANEAEKCARIDGIMTCDTGCGTINGDFVCVESPEDPTLPDPPAVDDDINDPTKTINDMTKADFKEVNKGVEARLDVLAQLMQQANNRPGISMGDTNRALGDLGSKIDALTDAVKEGFAGQEGDEDEDGGGDEEGGSVTYDTDRLTEFANANDWEQRNFGTVLVDMVDRIKETPTFSAASTFFDVSFAAECPIWSTSFTVFSQSFDFTVDQQCSDVMNQTWPWIRAVLLLVFSFLAFRVAYE